MIVIKQLLGWRLAKVMYGERTNKWMMYERI